MKTHLNHHALVPLLTLLLLAFNGCSRYAPGTKMSGDLVPFVMKCATKLGAHPHTKRLPKFETEWRFKRVPLKMGSANYVQDLIAISGDHLKEVGAFLKQAFGEIDPALGSRPVGPVKGTDGLLQGIYSRKQTGTTLSFETLTTRTFGVTTTTTLITVMGSPRT